VLAVALACGCSHAPVAVETAQEAPPSAASALADLRGSGPAMAYQAQSKLRSEDYLGATLLLRRVVKAAPALAKLDPGRRLARLEALAEELGASISAKAKALKGKIKATPALRQARAKWDEGYDAAKLVAEGLLVLDVGKAEAKKQLKGFFADLAVATRRKPKPEPGGGGASPPAKPLAP